MNHIVWYLEKNIFSDGTPEEMYNILKKKNIRVYWFDFEDRKEIKTKVKPTKDDFCIFYGSINTAKWIQENHPKWQPAYWINWEALECKNYMKLIGEFSLQKNHVMTLMKEVIENVNQFSDLFVDNKFFIRPNGNDKIFTGCLVHKDKVKDFIEDFEKYCGKDKTSIKEIFVMISKPQPVEREYRFIVHRGNVITGSFYLGRWDKDNEKYQKEAKEFASCVLKETGYNPDIIFSIDICRLTNGEYRVIEVGSFNCAGLYEYCDLEKVIDAVNSEGIKNEK